MKKLRYKLLVYGMALMLMAMAPISATAGDTPNGKPFLEIWEELEDLQEQIDNQKADIADLQAQLDAEIAARIAGDDALQAEIDAEEIARIAADIALQAAIDAEEASRIAEDLALQSNIDAEEAARIAADLALQAAINAEEAARIAADAALQAAINAEEAARIADVNAEEAARIAADNAEAAARQAADITLQVNIDNLAAIDALDYDSLADLESAMANGVNLATTSGGVGIGIESPAGQLHVGGKKEQIDQQQTLYSKGYTSPLWQSFTPGITGDMTRLDIRNVNLATPTSGTLKIYEGEGTSGTLLYTKSFSFSSGYGWKPLDMPNGPELTSGQKYTFKIEGGCRPGRRTANVYAGGRASWSANEDLMFKTYMTTPTTGLLVTSDGKVGIGTPSPSSTLHVQGDFVATGSKSSVVSTDSYGDRLLYCVEAPTVRLTDEGFAELEHGIARIELDPIFVETIEGDLLVHLTPYGPTTIYVDERGLDFFTVKSVDGTDVEFSWSVSAYRKGYTDVRLEEMGE